MGQAKARGPYAKTAARREEIVQAARESFAEHGYAHSSLRDIAARVGITAAGLLHHFRSKEELLGSVLAQRDTEGWEKGTAEVSSPDDFAPYFSRALREHQDAPELMCLWIELAAAASRPDHPAHSYFVDRKTRGVRHLVEGLREYAARGALRDGITPESAAVQIQAMLSGLQMQWLVMRTSTSSGLLRTFCAGCSSRAVSHGAEGQGKGQAARLRRAVRSKARRLDDG